jgi:nicotinamide phosphoribosyltransferase
VDVFKDPVTDSGKVSKKGRVTLYKNRTIGVGDQCYTGVEDWMEPVLREVFRDGELKNEITFDEVRANSMK